MRTCTPKLLPEGVSRLDAARVAVEHNPVNAPRPGVPLTPARMAVLTSTYWGPAPRRLTVSFLERPNYYMRLRVLRHMNAWRDGGCGVRFVYTTGVGDVRIVTGLADGYWSYVGTDVTLIPDDQPTMCLEGFTKDTPEAEYRRVVRHETGHTLGAPHEHMRRELVDRLDVERTVAYFQRWQRWDRQTTFEQVLTPLEDRSIIGGPIDDTSIMCYQLPGSITKTGRPIPGGNDITAADQDFMNRVYPR